MTEQPVSHDRPAATPGSAGDTPMRRLHPLTPLLRSWLLVAAGVGYVWSQVSRIFTDRVFGSVPGDQSETPTELIVLAALFGIALVVALGYGYLYWRFARYGVVSGVLRIETGVLSRRTRQVPLDRLQAVDVVRPLIARIAGVAELRIEVAGAGSDRATLAYLSVADAAAVRAELLARAAGLDASTPEAPELPLARVPLRDLTIGSVCSPATVVFVLLAIAGGSLVFAAGEAAIVVPMIPAIVGAGIAALRRFVVNYGFTIADSPDGLRIRKGLLDTRAQTVPPGRVQAVKITTPLLWRPWGLVRVDVNVAGYASGREREQEATSVVLPVGPRAVADALVRRVLPGVEPTTPATEAAPSRARWLRPIGAPRLTAGYDEVLFVAEQGWVTPQTVLMPQAKPQSVRISQGPIQRLLRLATVHLDSTAGPVSVAALHRDERAARAMLNDEVGHERAARTAAGPDRWMLGRTAT